MKKKYQVKKNPTIKTVHRQFKYWRSKRRPRTAIPEKLWQAAVGLTKEYSINQVAKRLGLNHTALSERTSKTESVKKETLPLGNNFVEISLSKPLSTGIKPPEIEVTDGRGWKFKISGHNVSELLLAAKRVWREEF